MLTVPLYMLQVFDRVITSRSVDTLIYLTLLACAALLVIAVVEAARTGVMVAISTWLERRLGGLLLAESIFGVVRSGRVASVQALRDLAVARNFVGGPSVFPILDTPWTPLYIAIIFLLHPGLGALAIGGGVVLLVLAVANDFATRKALHRATALSTKALGQADAAGRNADVILAMGMVRNMAERWNRVSGEALELQAVASRRGGRIAAASRFVRMMLQVGALGLGAWLVLEGAMTAGAMIAASILMTRALAPLDAAIASWRSAVVAKAAYGRVREALHRMPQPDATMRLPAPIGALKVESLGFQFAGSKEPLFRNLSFELEPGQSLGLIGATAAGKTTLARLLVGNFRPNAGHVRLDGADLAQWNSEDLGRHIGYLPQSIELFAGTVRENISRMTEGDPEAVVAAARMAGVHELILQLPDGYETEIGDGGAALSGGQRQRIALARALYGSPRLVVLDEPNSNLDQQGEEALLQALDALKEKAVTAIIIAHRPGVLRRVDRLLYLGRNHAFKFGKPDDVLPAVTRLPKDAARLVRSRGDSHV